AVRTAGSATASRPSFVASSGPRSRSRCGPNSKPSSPHSEPLFRGFAFSGSRRKVLGTIDVARRAEIVAGHEHGLERSCALVRDLDPGASPEHDGMAPLALVRRGDDLSGAAPPGLDHASA